MSMVHKFPRMCSNWAGNVIVVVTHILAVPLGYCCPFVSSALSPSVCVPTQSKLVMIGRRKLICSKLTLIASAANRSIEWMFLFFFFFARSLFALRFRSQLSWSICYAVNCLGECVIVRSAGEDTRGHSLPQRLVSIIVASFWVVPPVCVCVHVFLVPLVTPIKVKSTFVCPIPPSQSLGSFPIGVVVLATNQHTHTLTLNLWKCCLFLAHTMYRPTELANKGP